MSEGSLHKNAHDDLKEMKEPVAFLKAMALTAVFLVSPHSRIKIVVED